MSMQGVYVVHFRGVITVAKTLIQIKAGASSALEILRATVSQISTEVSDTDEFQLLRKTAAATVTSFTPLLFNPLSQVAKAVGGTAATGHTATVEGTDGDVLVQEGFNVLSGYVELATPEEQIVVEAGGIIAVKSAVTISSATLLASIRFREIG